MSTFTRIKTKTTIRDPEVMYRVLKSIPGAQIERNVLVSTIGHIIPSRVAFQVTLGNAAPSLGGLLGLVSLGNGVSSQRIYVRRSDNGTFTIEIGHEKREAVNAMRSVVRAALATNMPSTGSRELGPQTDAAPAPPKREQERLRRGPEKSTGEAPPQRESQGGTKRRPPPVEQQMSAAARAEAASLLLKLDQQHPAASGSPAGGDADDPSSKDQEMVSAMLSQALAQQYTKEKVLEQLEEVERQHGVSLGGIETLEDGTIEITLRG